MKTRPTSRSGGRAAAVRTPAVRKKGVGRRPTPTGATLVACERIWAAVARIPRGAVATYGGIAAAAGLARRARLVAYALRAAPPALDLPWHRVVAAGGRIAFPAGSASFREQSRRLAREGLRVVRGRVPLPAAEAGSLDALLWGPPR
jgi:methylated-DNA-protein-cysteine methyltransferase-like protein